MLRTTLLVIALLNAVALDAEDQGGTYVIAHAPAWVRAVSSALPAAGEGEGSHAVDILLVDDQSNVATREHYTRVVMQVRTQQGVQDGSSLMIDFDPSYQVLVLHSLEVIRQGVASSRLSRKAVQVLHREADLESFIIDGTLSASVVVQDVRVGDVIDYSYTVRGTNPVFNGRYRDTFSCGWHVPVQKEHIRVLFPRTRSIHWKAVGEVPQPARTESDGTTELEWTFADLKPAASEDLTPSWFVETPWIDVSEFAGWEDVRSWALALYPPATLPGALEAMVRQWSRERDGPEQRVRAALDYVQQNVRYLGIELGAGSYAPRAPAAVFETRFGDCKDKAYLLITILRTMGFDASPMLVNTSLRSLVGDLLPSPSCFNHVIVAVTLNGGRVLLDPTESYQRGDVTRRFVPDYGYGLLLARGSEGLDRFAMHQGDASDLWVEEKFTVGGRAESTRLNVLTVARGAAADSLREFFASHRLEEISRDYLNYYAERYPAITASGSLATEDRAESDEFRTNEFHTMESYTISGFWTEGEEKGSHVASFYPDVVRNEIPRPHTLVRSTPMRIDNPRHVVQKITIDLPEPWKVKAVDRTVATAAFSLHTTIGASAKTVSLLYDYRSGAEEVSASAMPEYNGAVKKVLDDLGYSLTWRAPGADRSSGPADPMVSLIMVLTTVVLFAGALGLYRWAVHARASTAIVSGAVLPVDETSSPKGLAGVLVLVAIGLFAAPFASMVNLSRLLPAFEATRWHELTSQAGSQYSPLRGPLLLFEAADAVATGLAGILLLVLFYQRRRLFPPIYIWVRIAGAVLVLVDSIVALLLPGNEGRQTAYSQLAAALVSCAIFIPYMLRSRRVRNTFVR